MVIVLRLVILGAFFHYRITNPVPSAYPLWLVSVICEIWFAISWILDQFPKWLPINRETYLDRLALRQDPFLLSVFFFSCLILNHPCFYLKGLNVVFRYDRKGEASQLLWWIYLLALLHIIQLTKLHVMCLMMELQCVDIWSRVADNRVCKDVDSLSQEVWHWTHLEGWFPAG